MLLAIGLVVFALLYTWNTFIDDNTATARTFARDTTTTTVR